MSNNKIISIVNYLFIFLVINYDIFVKFISEIDSTGYGLIFLSIIVVIFNGRQFSNLQLKKPIVFWLIWCFYVFINYYIHPHNNPIGVFALYRKIFIPLVTLTIVVKEYKENSYKLLWLCMITHIIYMLSGYYFDSGILYRDLGYNNDLGNAYATISSFSLFYLILLNRCGKLKTLWFVLLSIVVIFVLAMSGTRKAFGFGILLLCFYVLSYFNLKSIKSWIIVIGCALIGIWGYNYLMSNTFMGERMEFLESQQEQYMLPTNAPEFVYLLGDRAPHYYYGWMNFLDRPLLGVGVLQSRVQQESDILAYIHSEYIVQLSDNGIIGFLLFLMLYYWVGIRILRKVKKDKKNGRCMLGGLLGMLFLFLTAWAWEFPQYFICLGILIGYCQNGLGNPTSLKPFNS